VALFLSTFVNKVDKKGRISVPATFRAALSSQSFQGIIAFPSFVLPCVEGCGVDRMEQLSAGADNLDAFSAQQDDLSALIFADAHQLAFDSEGRVMLPEALISHARLGESAAFVGKGRTFQLWNPEAFKVAQDEARKRAMAQRPTLKLSPEGEGR